MADFKVVETFNGFQEVGGEGIVATALRTARERIENGDDIVRAQADTIADLREKLEEWKKRCVKGESMLSTVQDALTVYVNRFGKLPEMESGPTRTYQQLEDREMSMHKTIEDLRFNLAAKTDALDRFCKRHGVRIDEFGHEVKVQPACILTSDDRVTYLESGDDYHVSMPQEVS